MNQFPLAVERAFETLGLNKKHITVITYLHARDRVKVHEIAQSTKGIKRPELYSILNYLVKVQLVDRVHINNVASFELKKDADIVRWANKKRLEEQERYELSKISAHQIKEFIASNQRTIQPRPVVHFFEGSKGIEMFFKNIIAKAATVDMYIDHKRLYSHYPEYAILFSRIDGDNPKSHIRAIISGVEPDEIPIELHTNPQLFLRTNLYAQDHILTCLGAKWMVNFAVHNGVLKGFYVHCQNYDCVKTLRNMFEKDWEDSEELS